MEGTRSPQLWMGRMPLDMDALNSNHMVEKGWFSVFGEGLGTGSASTEINASLVFCGDKKVFMVSLWRRVVL